MKTRLVLSVIVLALVFIGCSDDPVEQTTESTNVDRGAERPFKVRSAGTFGVVEPDVCAPLAQIILEGTGNGTHIGLFDVVITWCDDFAGTTIQTGVVTAANGDKLYFYTSGFGADENGEYGEYTFEGGTGRFEDSNGFLILYNTVEFTGQGVGTYSNYGEGWLSY